MLPTIFCMRFIPSGPSEFDSYVFIGSCVAASYFLGAEGYSVCYGIFDTSCLYFSVV